MLSRINPFAGLPNRGQVLAWGMYDLANQSFQLLVNTLLFAIFLKKHVATSPEQGDSAWMVFVAASMLLAVIVSPIVGALADARAWKKPLLIGTGLVASALTAALAFLGPGDLYLAGALYITAAFAVNLGENFLGSFLPELSTEENVGRVSAAGWTLSYIGALGLLALTAIIVFGLGWQTPEEWRWIFVLGGLWFLGGMVPAMVALRETTPPKPAAVRGGIIADAFGQIADSARHARRYRQLVRFLSVFFVYSLGTYTVIFYAGKIGDDFKFGIGQLTLLALIMALTAGLSAIVTAQIQDRLGHRRTIMIFLAIWVVGTLGMAALKHWSLSVDWFWAIAAAIGLGLGGIGTGSRAMVGAFTPKEKAGEFFGLWGLVFKLAGVIGPATFGVVSKSYPVTGLVVLAGFFVLGLLLMPLVDEREGREAARARA